MQIYVYLNGTRRGPFTREQIQRMRSEGALQDGDLGAAQLEGEWKPLSVLLSAPEAVRPQQPPALEPSSAEPPEVRVAHDSLGRYVRATLGSNETVVYKTSVHWIIFVRYAGLALLVFIFVAIPFGIAVQAFTASQLGWFGLPLPSLILLQPAVLFSSSELIVTNRRVLIKTGAVHRQTLEMFISKVESVGVDQSVVGRMLGYGTVIIRGTGGSEEPFQTIAHPVGFRNAVQRVQTENAPDIRPA